jgi:hypothetical protein
VARRGRERSARRVPKAKSVVGSEDCASVVRRSVVGSVVGSVDCERREVRREESRSAGGVVRSVGVKLRSGGAAGASVAARRKRR